jgi:hypothetical protein
MIGSAAYAAQARQEDTCDERSRSIDAMCAGRVRSRLDDGWLGVSHFYDVKIGDLERLLPTEHELDRVPRTGVEAAPLGCLTATLTAQYPSSQEPMPAKEIAALRGTIDLDAPSWPTIKNDVMTVRLKFLKPSHAPDAHCCWPTSWVVR